MNKKSLLSKVKAFPSAPGVYLMKDARGRALYVGKSVSLRDRVLSYLRGGEAVRQNVQAMVSKIADVDYIETPSEMDALLAEQRLIKDLHPRYNVDLKDDKSYPYVEIRKGEAFPRILVSRKLEKGSKVYGPFTDVEELRAAHALLQRIFKFRVCGLEIRAEDSRRFRRRPCLYYYINSCLAPCAGRVSRGDYRKAVTRLCRFLDGKRSSVIRGIRREMEEAAGALDYEKAAQKRDELRALEGLSKRGLFADYRSAGALDFDPRRGLEELAAVMRLEQPPRLMEGVDVATISGSDSVGSVVTFADGRPYKNGYRKYRIKEVRGMDDFAMIREIVRRRYTRLKDEESLLPDFLLVDGGPGQLSAALEGLEAAGARPRTVGALAKREEIVFVEGRSKPLRLPQTSAGLKVLQFVRDEAHRFAQRYHHALRGKRLFGDRSVKVAGRARADKRRRRKRRTEKADEK
ncbi:MAG: UvrB/UvrC motif-containing protein [Planctomycetota bacterium]